MKQQDVLFAQPNTEEDILPKPSTTIHLRKSKKKTIAIPVSAVQAMSDDTIEISIPDEQPDAFETKAEETTNKVEQQAAEDKVTAEKKIEQLINNPSRTLFRAKGVFPFNFFPDEICVEEMRVNIITRNFFASQQVQTISYKDLKKVELESNLFFGTIRFITWTAVENEADVSFLKRDDAYKVRRLIEGLKILSEQKVDLSQIETATLLEQVEHLGSVK